MKKYLTLLFLVCAVALTFTGCYNSFESFGLSGDGNHSSGGTVNPGGGNHSSGGTGNPGGGSDKPSGGSADLIGTTWAASEEYNMSRWNHLLTFTGDNSISVLSTSLGEMPVRVAGTYSLDGSSISFNIEGDYSGLLKDSYTGSYNAKEGKIIINSGILSSGSVIFTKQ